MHAHRLAGLVAACALGASCREAPDVDVARAPEAPAAAWAEPIAPLPEPPVEDPALVALGAALFDSPLLSGDAEVACASCHLRERAYADEVPRSRPGSRPALTVNTPSLLNVAALDALNWDGRFTSLEEHLDALISNPAVQATTWADIEARLARAPELVAGFERAFSDGVSAANARAALLAFERSLASPGAPFDRWLRGERGALPEAARRGYAVFKSYGCVSCHQGELVGGNVFARLGVMRPYPARAAEASRGASTEVGRMLVTGLEQDRFVFRVPSLRNVALTAPYLHDGSLPSLRRVVGVMATYQLGRALEVAQIEDVVAFLESLTGSVGGALP